MPKGSVPPARVRAARQAARVTVASLAGFYPALYALDRPVVAVYALFTPIALGVLSPVPGGGRRRARTVLLALPAAVALACLGTALAATTASAVAGMLVIGFVVSLGSAYGPAPASTVPGLLLFYVLACFPPYAPDTLPQRLCGLLAGGLLLILCERFVLPAPAAPSCRARIAQALDLAASSALAAARGHGDDPDRARRLRAEGRALRLSQLPAASRPTGADRTSRGLAHCGSATRRVLDHLARTFDGPVPRRGDDPHCAALLRAVAAACGTTAESLRGRRAVPAPEILEEEAADFVATRGQATEEGRREPSPRLLRHRSDVLAISASALTAQTAAAIAFAGRRASPGLPYEQFWYARPSTAVLLLARLRGNLTLRSVLFQNAARTALGLGAARLVAGTLDLAHGFWVLLAVLTLGRTTAGATWATVRKAAVGTLLGALAAGALLVGAGGTTVVYAVVLVPAMFVAFAVGPVAGPAWAQGLFTLVVSAAFSQLTPTTWRLAEVRLLDVVTGCGIGLLCGVLAWPAGARAEVRRGVAELLRAVGPLVALTTDELVGSPGGTRAPDRAAAQALRLARHRLRIAEGAYAQYRTEGGASAEDPDWLAALNCGSHAMVGAHWLPLQDVGPAPPDAARWARASAAELVTAMDRAALLPPGGVRARPAPLPAEVITAAPAPVRPTLVDIDSWLRTLAAELAAVGGRAGDEPPRPADRGTEPGTRGSGLSGRVPGDATDPSSAG
ncbi:FUSC family protein [Streptomyces sp. NPDC048566]|uniref:FUSC family protein n=1 Tax=Streptomyces sp. NPDC048566 TaxID=3365569 RepID=UPI00371638C2